MSDEFEKDADGNIKVFPLTGWTTAPVARMAIILKPIWASSPEYIPHGDQSTQLILTPQQALELAEKLKKLVEHVLSEKPTASPS